MSDAPQNYPDEDTISLIDLVAVLIRYRRMIVAGTLVVFVLAAAVLYGIPLIVANPFDDEQEYRVERRIAVQPIPNAANRYISLNVQATLQEAMRDPVVVARAYRNMRRPLSEGLEERLTENPPTRAEFLRILEKEILEEDLTTSWNGNASAVVVRYSTTDPQSGRQFLQRLIEEASAEFLPVLETRIRYAERTLERSLELSRNGLTSVVANALRQSAGVDESQELPNADMVLNTLSAEAENAIASFGETVNALEGLREMKENPGSLYSALSPPVTIVIEEEDEGAGRATTVVVATITAFFLFVFGAFVRQYIQNVSRDPEEVGKLKAAWEGRDRPEGT